MKFIVKKKWDSFFNYALVEVNDAEQDLKGKAQRAGARIFDCYHGELDAIPLSGIYEVLYSTAAGRVATAIIHGLPDNPDVTEEIAAALLEQTEDDVTILNVDEIPQTRCDSLIKTGNEVRVAL